MIMVNNSLNLLKSFLNTYKEIEGNDVKIPKDCESILGNMCLFSVFWGVGGSLEENTRK